MWGEIAGAVLGNAIGGYFQHQSTKETNEANAALNAQNIAHQKEFAQQGIRWKVADAMAAGIHPLVGLGASTTSFAPSSIGATPDTSMADTARGMGQDITRAISSTRTQFEKDLAQLQLQGAQLDLEDKAIGVQIKKSTLAKMNAPGSTAFPGDQGFVEGQGNSSGPGRIANKPMERTMSLPGAPHSEPGALPDVGWVKTPTGIIPVPSKDAKERTEDVMPHEWSHYFRNNIAPNWGGGPTPPKSALPKGATEWEWSYKHQEFQPYFPKYKFERR